MARNPQRLAWVVLWISFLVFCCLVVGIPWSINLYRANATQSETVSLETLNGTVLLQEKGSNFEVNAEGKRSGDSKTIVLGEGDSVRTVENSRAILWLFDGSNVQLWPNTSITIAQLRHSRYSDNSALLAMSQNIGHSHIEVSPPTTKARRFEIGTPEATLQLREGSFSIDRNEGSTEISTHSGSASVLTANGGVELLKKERTRITADTNLLTPLPAAQNLILNGSFLDKLTGWQVANRGEEEPILGTATNEVDDSRSVVRFKRTGATKHAETYIFQQLNKDVTDFETVKLAFDFKLVAQSLSGGGIAGSEYPIMVRLKYKDVYGSEASYIRGFYFHNEAGYPTANGQLVPQNQWQTFIVDVVGPESRLQPRPSGLLWLEIAASGHNYESEITNIQLIAE